MHTNTNIERFGLRPRRLRPDPEHHCHFCPASFYKEVSRDDHEQYRHRERNG